MSASAQAERFHTVVIRGDLPKVEKQYRADKPADLPPESFWIDQVAEDVVGNRWDGRQQANRFKLQHMISNGPRECFIICDVLRSRFDEETMNIGFRKLKIHASFVQILMISHLLRISLS